MSALKHTAHIFPNAALEGWQCLLGNTKNKKYTSALEIFKVFFVINLEFITNFNLSLFFPPSATLSNYLVLLFSALDFDFIFFICLKLSSGLCLFQGLGRFPLLLNFPKVFFSFLQGDYRLQQTHCFNLWLL